VSYKKTEFEKNRTFKNNHYNSLLNNNLQFISLKHEENKKFVYDRNFRAFLYSFAASSGSVPLIKTPKLDSTAPRIFSDCLFR